MPIVKMDDRGRIQLPKELRKELRLRARQPLVVRREGEELRLTKAKELDPAKDPLLRDILLHPLKSKVKITKKLLDKLEEEQWSG